MIKLNVWISSYFPKIYYKEKEVYKSKSLPYAGVIQVKFNGFFISAEFSAPRVIDNEIYLNKIKLHLIRKAAVKK